MLQKNHCTTSTYHRLLLGDSSLGLLGATELLAAVLALLALLAGSLLDLHKTMLIDRKKRTSSLVN